MYKAPVPKLWKGRIDPEDGQWGHRWHQRVELVNLAHEQPPGADSDSIPISLLGFASDEGVKRNQGRLGAVQGPTAIRQALAGLSWHLSPSIRLFDLGEVVVGGSKLEQAQEEAGNIIGSNIDLGHLPIILGGGHEVAWASMLGYSKSSLWPKSLGIINIDAHFDMRKAEEASSGTPFLQMAELCHAQQLPFHYLCLGIQKYSNTQALFRTAAEKGVSFLLAEELLGERSALLQQSLTDFLKKVDYIYLTIDLDGFDGSYAPAVSSPAIGGLSPQLVLPLIQQIARSGKLVVADIAEMNPRFDQDNRTAKLAARCAFEIAMNYVKVGG